MGMTTRWARWKKRSYTTFKRTPILSRYRYLANNSVYYRFVGGGKGCLALPDSAILKNLAANKNRSGRKHPL